MAEGFTCAVENKQHRSACKGLPKYSGSRYCVLHEPAEEKDKELFVAVKESKLARKDYDFGGTVFPEGTSDFEGREFASNTNFNGATFVGFAHFRAAKFSSETTNFQEAKFRGTHTSFRSARFSDGTTNFYKVEFSGAHTSFRNAKFSGEATDFSRAEFSGETTNFREAKFRGERTDFSEAKFRAATTSFCKAEFRASYQTEFHDAEFRGVTTSFSRTEFSSSEQINFSNTQFVGEPLGWIAKRTDFSRAKFSDRAPDFQEAVFGAETTDFCGAQFPGRATNLDGLSRMWADFRPEKFGSVGAYFDDAKICGEGTDFRKAKFTGERIDFRIASFRGATSFREAEFSGQLSKLTWTSFSGARFRGVATDFSGVIFGTTETNFREVGLPESPEPSMGEIAFTGSVAFSGATFKEKVAFWGATEKPSIIERPVFSAESKVSFDRARLEKPELLSFHTVILRPGWFINVDVRKVDFTNVRWVGPLHVGLWTKPHIAAEISRIEEWGFRSPEILLSQVCRRLSGNAEDGREYRLANEFYYWSMDTRRREGLRSIGLIGTLYWALSGYGVRAARAFCVLFAWWALFAFLYMVAGPSQLKVFSISLQDIVAFLAGLGVPSLSEVGQFIADIGPALVYSLGALARLRPEPQPDVAGLFQLLVTAEGILGPLQIALLALAIRRQVMR